MAIVGMRVFDLHIPATRSLKEKRFVVRSVKDRIGNRFNVSIAETGALDKWQRAEIAVATVGRQRRSVEQTLDAIRSMLDREPEIHVIDVVTEYC